MKLLAGMSTYLPILSYAVFTDVWLSIDNEIDKLVQRTIREEFCHHTIISVAHRLHTIPDFDKVGVMDKGIVVEFEDPKVLIQRNSLFEDLYDSFQMKQDGFGANESIPVLDQIEQDGI